MMTYRKRMQLIAALVIAPLVVAMPVLLPRLGEPGFVRRYLDMLIIFVLVPYGAALSLYVGDERSSSVRNRLAGALRRRSKNG
ncbi:MAG TPA: hypothetical protein VHE36_11210 [Sphingomicrobium sp.]|jgi:hypothetical protein|nr:hypothetical protein [Sphingomicrobium sp.]